MRRFLYALPVVAFVALAAFFYKGLFLDPSEVPNALAGRPVPTFDLPGIGGGPGLSSEDLTGTVTVLNVFASWCVPCRAEHPFLMELAERDLARMVGINYKDKPEDALAWLDELGDPFEAIGADVDGRVGIDFGVYGVPETFIIDGNGVIRYKHVGPLMARDMEKIVYPMLEGAEP